jgi:thiol-disulfide isomerase/thioredoxin
MTFVMATLFMLEHGSNVMDSRARVELGITLVILVLAGSLVGAVGVRQGQLERAEEDAEALDFTVTTIDGDILTLSELRGKPVVLDLMATWCMPCRQQMPELNRTYNDYSDRVTFISIDMDWSETDQQLREFRDEFGAEWAFAIDMTGSVYGAFFPTGYPTVVLIDEDGRVVKRHTGAMGEGVLRTELDGLLG